MTATTGGVLNLPPSLGPFLSGRKLSGKLPGMGAGPRRNRSSLLWDWEVVLILRR